MWVIFPKKATGQSCMSYEESVEEALCHGWIDSLIKRIDDSSYARKFTPRKDNQTWSESNRRRVVKLIEEGRMTAVGLAKINYRNTPPPRPPSFPKAPPVPDFMEQALRRNKEAWDNFVKLAPSHKRGYVHWITMAKREETRVKRLEEAVRMLARNQKLGLK